MGTLERSRGASRSHRHGFGRFGGDLLVGNFGDGRINAFRRTAHGWAHDGVLRDRRLASARRQRPLGNRVRKRRARRPEDTLFFASGPHVWRGDTELAVHGLLGAIRPS